MANLKTFEDENTADCDATVHKSHKHGKKKKSKHVTNDAVLKENFVENIEVRKVKKKKKKKSSSTKDFDSEYPSKLEVLTHSEEEDNDAEIIMRHTNGDLTSTVVNTSRDEDSNHQEDDPPFPLALKPSDEALNKMLDRIASQLPTDDHVKFDSRVKKINWSKVAFEEIPSASDCKEIWFYIQERIRRFRTLCEMLPDAKTWVMNPWTSFYKSKNYNRHPEMPKKPLSVYMLFYSETRANILRQNPNMSMPEVAKVCSERYMKITDAEKDVYRKRCFEMRREYSRKLDSFYQKFPHLKPLKAAEKRRRSKAKALVEQEVENRIANDSKWLDKQILSPKKESDGVNIFNPSLANVTSSSSTAPPSLLPMVPQSQSNAPPPNAFPPPVFLQQSTPATLANIRPATMAPFIQGQSNNFPFAIAPNPQFQTANYTANNGLLSSSPSSSVMQTGPPLTMTNGNFVAAPPTSNFMFPMGNNTSSPLTVNGHASNVHALPYNTTSYPTVSMSTSTNSSLLGPSAYGVTPIKIEGNGIAPSQSTASTNTLQYYNNGTAHSLFSSLTPLPITSTSPMNSLPVVPTCALTTPTPPQTVTTSSHTPVIHSTTGGQLSTGISNGDLPPIRPSKPFDLFFRHRSESQRVECFNSGVPFCKQSVLDKVRVEWKALKVKKRGKWVQKTVDDYKRYLDEAKAYATRYPSYKVVERKAFLTQEDQKVLDKLSGRPEKPGSSAYSLFSKELLTDETFKSQVDSKERMSEISNRWKCLTSDQKLMYQHKVDQSMSEYRVAYDTWFNNLTQEKRDEEMMRNQRTLMNNTSTSNATSKSTTTAPAVAVVSELKTPTFTVTPLLQPPIQPTTEQSVSSVTSQQSLVKIEPLSMTDDSVEYPLPSPQKSKTSETRNKEKRGTKVLEAPVVTVDSESMKADILSREPQEVCSTRRQLFIKEWLNLHQHKKKKMKKMPEEAKAIWAKMAPKAKVSWSEKLKSERESYIESYTTFVRGLNKDELDLYTSIKGERDALDNKIVDKSDSEGEEDADDSSDNDDSSSDDSDDSEFE